MSSGGPLPPEAFWEALAQHWHTTPGNAREQDEYDVDMALAWQGGVAKARRYFSE